MKKQLSIHAALVLGALSLPLSVFSDSPGPISEETPPAICDPGTIVKDVTCSGKYCDNLRISCSPVGTERMGSHYWTPFFSEEHGGMMFCAQQYYIAGLACKGKYCDNISLLCSHISGAYEVSCQKTRPVSEEGQGTVHFFMGDKAGQKFAAKAMKCTGKYCDNKEFDVCEIGFL